MKKLETGFGLVKLLISITKAIAFIITFFLVYLGYYKWDMGRLKAFCEDLQPGTPVSQLVRIAEQYGFSPSWFKTDGAFDQTANQWTLYIPSISSVGANVCAIKHNKVTVISTKIEID